MSYIEEVYDFSNNLEHFLNPAGCNFCPAGYGAIRCVNWTRKCLEKVKKAEEDKRKAEEKKKKAAEKALQKEREKK